MNIEEVEALLKAMNIDFVIEVTAGQPYYVVKFPKDLIVKREIDYT